MSFTSLIRKYYFGDYRIHCDDPDEVNRYDVGINNENHCHRGCSSKNNNNNNNNLHQHKELWNIGGPNTILPRCIESFLCWSLALSCLSISGYHYIMDNYIINIKTYQNVILLGVQEYVLFPFLRLLFLGPSRDRQVDEGDPKEPQQQLQQQQQQQFPCWLPLMTYSRAELQRGTPLDRFQQLLQVIDHIHPTRWSKKVNEDDDDDDKNHHYYNNDNNKTSNSKSNYYTDTNCVQCTLSDDELIQLIRQNEIVRRLVSLALRPSSSNDGENDDVRKLPFGQQLIRIWSQLLVLPPIIQLSSLKNNNNNPVSSSLDNIHCPTAASNQATMLIALIIPCYHETTNDIVDKLNYALQNCHSPQLVQVRLVMAGCNKEKNTTIDLQQQQHQQLQLALRVPTRVNKNDSHHHQNPNHQWGDIQIIEFLEESGRGPCLNYGSTYYNKSQTRSDSNDDDDHHPKNILVYTFCHSDTRLPYHWDQTLMQTLYPPPSSLVVQPTKHHHHQCHNDKTSLPTNEKRINACAYRFGIDTSGLQTNHRHPSHDDDDEPQNYYYPPGIHAIEVTANLRCTLWSLPYGDQCISMRADDFHYLGGFPHQCLMEDYELVTLLRKRMKLLSLFRLQDRDHPSSSSNDIVQKEEVLQILSGPPVLCSPRRWQKFGVFYVTYTNSRLVQLYNQKKKQSNVMTQPEEIYQLYYGQRLDVMAPKSPWEIELEHILNKTK